MVALASIVDATTFVPPSSGTHLLDGWYSVKIFSIQFPPAACISFFLAELNFSKTSILSAPGSIFHQTISPRTSRSLIPSVTPPDISIFLDIEYPDAHRCIQNTIAYVIREPLCGVRARYDVDISTYIPISISNIARAQLICFSRVESVRTRHASYS